MHVRENMHDTTHVLMDYANLCTSKHAYKAGADAYAYMAIKTTVKRSGRHVLSDLA